MGNKDGPLYRFTRQGDMHARPHTIVKERALHTRLEGRQNATVAGGAEEETTTRQSRVEWSGHGEMVLKTGDRPSEVSQNFGMSSRE